MLTAGRSAALAAQCVPTDPALHSSSAYDEFLIARRELIAERLNEFLDTAGLGDATEHLDPRLRELDAHVVAVEIELRRLICLVLNERIADLPSHVQRNIKDRADQLRRTRPGSFPSLDLAGALEFCDLRELQDILVSKQLWPRFASRFGTQEQLAIRFGQLAALRNSLRHVRTVDDVTRKDGEAAILWFRGALAATELENPTQTGFPASESAGARTEGEPTAGGSTPAPPTLPTSAVASDEAHQAFAAAMTQVYSRAKSEIGYNDSYLLQMLAEHGPLDTAHRLINSAAPSDGFTHLWERRRLDLSVEAHALRPEFAALFSEEELAICRRRLADYGYTPSVP